MSVCVSVCLKSKPLSLSTFLTWPKGYGCNMNYQNTNMKKTHEFIETRCITTLLKSICKSLILWWLLMTCDDPWWLWIDSGWLWMNLDESWWLLKTLDDSWWLLMTLDDSWWLLMTLDDSWWLLMFLGDSWWLLFEK